jgi:hypothetical protein
LIIDAIATMDPAQAMTALSALSLMRQRERAEADKKSLA